jgi:hypothetical protein
MKNLHIFESTQKDHIQLVSQIHERYISISLKGLWEIYAQPLNYSGQFSYPLPNMVLPLQSETSGESASLPQYLGCNTVFDMRLRVTFLRRKTVSLQSNIAHRE